MPEHSPRAGCRGLDVGMRAIWTGYVSFGLVTIPVHLYSGTEEHGAGFHQVHARDGSRIWHRRVCESEGVKVPQSEIAHGLEFPDGRTVVLRDEDLAKLALPTKRAVDVLGFVDERGVDPVLYSRAYWVGADEQDQRPYALLVEALARHGRVVVANVTLRTRERLAVLRPRHGILVLHTLLWLEEIREPDARDPLTESLCQPSHRPVSAQLIAPRAAPYPGTLDDGHPSARTRVPSSALP
ncbi:Ku protein [Streptomyces sp. NPDC001902]